MTSFSILFARSRDLVVQTQAPGHRDLRPGDSILVAEACPHHPTARISPPRSPLVDAIVGGNSIFTVQAALSTICRVSSW
jgi:hypothetical protein